jgi:hypothetical protein
VSGNRTDVNIPIFIPKTRSAWDNSGVNSRGVFIAGLVCGVLAASLGFIAVGRFAGASRIESLLKLSDRDLIGHQSQIEEMEGLDGKIMKAILACAGLRLKNEHSDGAPDLKPQSTQSGGKAGSGMQAGMPISGPANAGPVNAGLSGASSSVHSSALTSGSAFDSNHFFCSQVRDNPLAVGADAKWSTLFPQTPISPRPVTASFGWATGAEVTSDFLNQRTCKAPSFLEFKDGEKEQLTYSRVFCRSIRRVRRLFLCGGFISTSIAQARTPIRNIGTSTNMTARRRAISLRIERAFTAVLSEERTGS